MATVLYKVVLIQRYRKVFQQRRIIGLPTGHFDIKTLSLPVFTGRLSMLLGGHTPGILFPHMDSNHDCLNQNQKCYHYTIREFNIPGKAGAPIRCKYINNAIYLVTVGY
jgi:hypothetical protein